MRNKIKLKLVSDNPDLNQGLSEGIVRKVTLEESFTNDAYNYPDPPTTELFARQIDHFELNIKDFDHAIPSNGS